MSGCLYLMMGVFFVAIMMLAFLVLMMHFCLVLALLLGFPRADVRLFCILFLVLFFWSWFGDFLSIRRVFSS